MSSIYVHVEQSDEIGPEGRSYSITENLLEFQGRNVLYLYVSASEISFCDRNYAAHLANVNVKGYVKKWKYDVNEKGETLSVIEPVTSEEDKREMSKILRTTHNVQTINFI